MTTKKANFFESLANQMEDALETYRKESTEKEQKRRQSRQKKQKWCGICEVEHDAIDEGA